VERFFETQCSCVAYSESLLYCRLNYKMTHNTNHLNAHRPAL